MCILPDFQSSSSRELSELVCAAGERGRSASPPSGGSGCAERLGALRAAQVCRVWKGAAGGGACPLCARGRSGGAAAAGGRGGVSGRSVHVCRFLIPP